EQAGFLGQATGGIFLGGTRALFLTPCTGIGQAGEHILPYMPLNVIALVLFLAQVRNVILAHLTVRHGRTPWGLVWRELTREEVVASRAIGGTTVPVHLPRARDHGPTRSLPGWTCP